MAESEIDLEKIERIEKEKLNQSSRKEKKRKSGIKWKRQI